MPANFTPHAHHLLMLISMTAIVIGTAVLLGAGEAVLIVAVTLPFTLALLFAHEQHIAAINQCTRQYLSDMKSHR
jgi:high-affinity nickel permease